MFEFSKLNKIFLDAELPVDLRAKLESTTTETSAVETEKIIYPDPGIERDVYECPAPAMSPYGEPNLFQNAEFMELLTRMQKTSSGVPSGNILEHMKNDSFIFGEQQPYQMRPPVMPDTKMTKLLKSKLHIGLLAILTYSFINSGYSCNVFLIFLVWEMVEMFVLKQYENKSGGVMNILFLLSGVSPAKLNVFFKWIEIGKRVLRDVAIFLFFFVISHICCGGKVEPDSSEPKIEQSVETTYIDEFGVEF